MELQPLEVIFNFGFWMSYLYHFKQVSGQYVV